MTRLLNGAALLILAGITACAPLGGGSNALSGSTVAAAPGLSATDAGLGPAGGASTPENLGVPPAGAGNDGA